MILQTRPHPLLLVQTGIEIMRTVEFRYQDPLDVIWLHAAAQLGIRVERSSEVFAAWDGKGVLTIGSADTLDADDSLAQMILHEICHGLVEGPDAFHKPDWGVDITNHADRIHEYACLRLQAALTQRYGLREFFAATTVFRRYYDSLSSETLKDTDDPAVQLALPGWERATRGEWSVPLRDALKRTSQIVSIVNDIATADSLWMRTEVSR